MIRCDEFLVVYDSVTMYAIDPENIGLSKEDLENYIAEHPYPDDPVYPEQDFINDITMSSGFYCLPRRTSWKTREWICNCLNSLL